MEIVVSNKASRPLYEQIVSQIRAQIMSNELKAGEALPSIRSLAKSLQISVLTVQKAYDILQEDGFIETTAGKGCYVSVRNQYFYLEEQQKKIEGCFNDAIEIARMSGIPLDKLIGLLTLLYEEENPLLLQGQSHFPAENEEENPLLLQEQSHFPAENEED